MFTSHVLLALEDDERIAAVGFALLVTLFVGVCVLDQTNLQFVSDDGNTRVFEENIRGQFPRIAKTPSSDLPRSPRS